MKTINIKGKEYVPVVERIKEFHTKFPKGWIETDAIRFGDKITSETNEVMDSGNRAVVRAKIYLGDGRSFTGWSQSEFGKGMMGNVALEVAETSAIGRALGFANIGLLDGIASADEMRKVGKGKTDTSKPPFGEGSDEDIL